MSSTNVLVCCCVVVVILLLWNRGCYSPRWEAYVADHWKPRCQGRKKKDPPEVVAEEQPEEELPEEELPKGK